MTTSCRSCWRNAALYVDSEIVAIDELENKISPLSQNALKIRELITRVELCHHKAERWVYNIIEAIGKGESNKGMGTRPSGQKHPRETVWENVCTLLSSWCAGDSTSKGLLIDSVPASQMIEALGERSSLKVWQVQRVIEKIWSVICWSQPCEEEAKEYEWLLVDGNAYELVYLNQCPKRFKEHEDFWLTTVRTMIHDTENGDKADLSLALAIDMLWPCHWKFVENLQIVLNAIGGQLKPDTPFAACGWNITLVPIRQHMEVVSHTLKNFCGEPAMDYEMDRELQAMLGNLTEEKKWLAASLDKTIRLQLNPPPELRKATALAGPEWIKH